MLIDSHCHLDYFSTEELPDVLARAQAAGVGEVVTISTRLAQAETLSRLTGAHDGAAGGGVKLWSTVGIHPHQAGEAAVPVPAEIAALAAAPRVVGIGESGLDYFYDTAPREAQRASFRAHIRAARLADLPLVVHARDADEDVARILREERDAGGPFGFLLHCFSSGRALAEEAVATGGYVSFSGILTFAKSDELRDIARAVPDERILVETDAPFLAPMPVRGKRNEPSYVAHTAARLAEVRGLSAKALATLTTANFRRLFRKTA